MNENYSFNTPRVIIYSTAVLRCTSYHFFMKVYVPGMYVEAHFVLYVLGVFLYSGYFSFRFECCPVIAECIKSKRLCGFNLRQFSYKVIMSVPRQTEPGPRKLNSPLALKIHSFGRVKRHFHCTKKSPSRNYTQQQACTGQTLVKLLIYQPDALVRTSSPKYFRRPTMM